MPTIAKASARYRDVDSEPGASRFLFVGTGTSPFLHMHEWSNGGGFGAKIPLNVGSYGNVADIQFDGETDRLFFSSGDSSLTSGQRAISMASVSNSGLAGIYNASSSSSPGSAMHLRIDSQNNRLAAPSNSSSHGGRLLAIGETTLDYVLTSVPTPARVHGIALDLVYGRVAFGVHGSSTVQLRSYSPPETISNPYTSTPLIDAGTTCESMEFSANGNRLICATNATPNSVLVLNTTGGGPVVSQFPAFPDIPSSLDVKLNPAGTIAAFATRNTAPRIALYSFDGSDLVAKLPSPDIPPAGEAKKVAWSPDGREIAVVTSASPYVYAYKIVSGHVMVKYANPVTTPGSAGSSVCFAR